MLHAITFMRRKAGTSRSDFHALWHNEHAARVSQHGEVRRHVHCHPLAEAMPGLEEAQAFDGVSEVWVDSVQAWDRVSPLVLALPDVARSITLLTEDHTILSHVPLQQQSDMVKLMYVIKRKAGMSLAAFSHYYKHEHTRVSARLPGQRIYVQCHRVATPVGTQEPSYDAVSQIWLDDLEALQVLSASSELQQGVRDCGNFLDMNQFFSFAGRDQRLVWPAAPAWPPAP